jgi:hypothetical protein
MNETVATNVILVLLVLEVTVAIVSAAYVLTAYINRADESIWFRELAQQDLLIAIAGFFLAPVAILAFFGLPRLPFTGVIVGLIIVVLLLTPIRHALLIYRLRRGR